jgi:hypothetical protein
LQARHWHRWHCLQSDLRILKYGYRKFGWITDAESKRIELWELREKK